MKTYLEISITSNERQRELLIATMVELGCQGFQETDDRLLCYIDKSQWDQQKTELLSGEIKKILQTISANAAIQFREFQEENWNAQWEQSIRPIEVGKRFVVKPSWADYENAEGRIVIQIDPKMSFGTGYHETTRLTLQLLERYCLAGYTLLDVGTGTGILAIAAIKLGVTTAVGTDIDEWAIENAEENVAANGVAEEVLITSAALHQLEQSTFDLITANLTLNTNIELLDQFCIKLIDGGLLLLSGLLLHDRDSMVDALVNHRFQIVEELVENEWIALAAKKLP